MMPLNNNTSPLISMHVKMIKKNIKENEKYKGKPWFKPNKYISW